METNKKRRGFTLIEMLVVIAIIAVLVAIVVPTVSSSNIKAKAATDAANLRSILAILNVKLLDNNGDIQNALSGMTFPECKSYEDTHVEIEYAPSHYIHVYYVANGSYYGTDYFSEVATSGSSTNTAKPNDPNADWYVAGNN